MRIEFGEWLPDLPPHGNPGCTEAKNLVPLITSFGPMKNLRAFSTALTEACLGAFWMPDLTGAANNFSGDQSKLYNYTEGSATWADKSRKQADGAAVNTASYAAAVSWSFEKFGNRCIAVDVSNEPQYFDLASSSTFLDLGGSPPKAKYIATVRDFLVLAHLSGLPNRLHWSGFNSSELWTSSLATQSDFQDLPGRGGQIQAIVPGQYGIIFQESSIWKMTYTGPPTVFQLDEVVRGIGTPAPMSVVWYGTNVFFYDNSGFQFFNGTDQPTPIGNDRVDKWFTANSASRETMVGVVDRLNQLVMWAFKSLSSKTYNDRIIIFNFASNKWAWAEVETQYLYERVSGQLTLDELDTPLNEGIDIDSIPTDALFFSQELNVSGFDNDNRSGAFDGSAMAATITSTEISNDDATTETRAVRPLIDGGDATIQIGYRHRLDRDPVFTNTLQLSRLGEANKMVNARYQRFRLNISNEFDFLQGLEIKGRAAGRR